MSAPSTHPSLLARLRDPGDQAAWREFDARYGSLIAAYGRARGLQPADAEDLRQMVLTKLLRSLQHFDYQPTQGRFRSYVWRVAQGEWIRLNRRHTSQSTQVITDDDLPPESAEAIDSIWEREWMRLHFRRAWESIRRDVEPRSMEIFSRLLAGEPTETIASSFGLSSAGVRKVKQRIRDRLETLIRAQVQAEEDEDDTIPLG